VELISAQAKTWRNRQGSVGAIGRIAVKSRSKAPITWPPIFCANRKVLRGIARSRRSPRFDLEIHTRLHLIHSGAGANSNHGLACS